MKKKVLIGVLVFIILILVFFVGLTISSKFRRIVIKSRDYIFDEEGKIQRKIHSKEIEECEEKGGYWDNIFGGEYFCKNFTIKKEENGYIEFELKKEIEFASVNKEDLNLMKEYVFKHGDLKSESIENKNFRKRLNFESCGKQKYNCDLFKYNQDIYKVDFDKESEKYNFYKNDEIIFSDDMFMITNGPILEFGIIDEKVFFTYNKLDNSEVKKLEDGSIQGYGHIETYFNGELLTEKYNYSSIKKVFVYKDKIGFLGIKNGKTYIFYNGKEITNGFDRIEVYPCCAIPSLFELDLEKGIIWFLAQRDGKDYIVYKNLNVE